jgi:ADP-ribose pyrophosphatase YjhB (NUDIX family)
MFDIQIKVGALVENGGQLFLISEIGQSTKYLLNIVKGTFDPKLDKNLLATAVRECQEEINVKVKVEKILNFIYFRENKKIRLQFNFLCKVVGKNQPKISSPAKQKIYQENINDCKLFSKVELKKLKPKVFIDQRAYLAVSDYLAGKSLPLSVLREIIL